MDDGYPTVEELNKISRWPYTDGAAGWFGYIKSKWKYADAGMWTEATRTNGPKELEAVFGISTGGWSGNEDILDAMRKNNMLWMLSWYSSRRGGHYVFRVRELFMNPQAKEE
jgi:hypothetical protein